MAIRSCSLPSRTLFCSLYAGHTGQTWDDSQVKTKSPDHQPSLWWWHKSQAKPGVGIRSGECNQGSDPVQWSSGRTIALRQVQAQAKKSQSGGSMASHRLRCGGAGQDICGVPLVGTKGPDLSWNRDHGEAAAEVPEEAGQDNKAYQYTQGFVHSPEGTSVFRVQP